MTNWQFYITNISSVETEVFPLNFLECSFVDEQEENSQFYRRKFEGSLTFGGKKLCADFNYFYAYEQVDPCEVLYLSIYKDSTLYWEGYFSTSMGDWDLDEATFTVTPLVIDDLTDWDETGDEEFNILDIPTEVTVFCDGWEHSHNRWLIDVIEFLADKVFPGVSVVSEFFTQVTNYVTHQPNQLLYLTIAQKSDIKNNLASNPASEGMMSFNELMDILRGMFNVYWTYEAAFDLMYVEHISTFANSPGLDIRTQEMAFSTNKYKYLQEEMPKYESWFPMEGMSPDFRKGNIFYTSKCVNQDPDSNTSEFRMRVTTDIEYIQDSVLAGDGGVISNDGFVMLANYLSGGDYHTYMGAGIYDSTVRYNIPLAWSYLLYYFHRHDRVILDGFFNGIERTFISAKKTKVQECNIALCTNFYPELYMTTELGETYFGGEKAYVRKAVIKPYGEINLTLVYGPADNADGGIVSNDRVINVVVVGLDVYTYLSEPNLVDTYYWIWTNESTDPDDVCDEIMIPAGTMYQEDILTQPNPITEISFNFDDVSLTDWETTVDGSTTYDTHLYADCPGGVPPVPPAAPAAPTITGHTQSGTCAPVRIIWGSVATATYYVLQRNPSLGGNPVWETQYSGINLSYDDYDAGVNEGTTYLYRAAAGNVGGLSGWSAEHTVDDIIC